MSSMAARAELRDIKKLIHRAEQQLLVTHKKMQSGVGRAKKKLEQRQARVWARIRKLADEWRKNKLKLAALEPAWLELKKEITAIETELERLQRRAISVRTTIRNRTNPARSAAARIAGIRSAEVRGEWWARYLRAAEDVHVPGGGPVPAPLAIAIARRLKLAAKFHETPDLAAARGLSEYLHDAPEAYWDFIERQAEHSWRRVAREHYAQVASGHAPF